MLLNGARHPDDALVALHRRATGLIVSNHGGRTLDTLPAIAELLPVLRAAVGDAVPLHVDGGIRRGTDVQKALALAAAGARSGPWIAAFAR